MIADFLSDEMHAIIRGAVVLLSLTMLLLLIAAYCGCFWLVSFCERLIGPQQ